jgi:hypothetical protein
MSADAGLDPTDDGPWIDDATIAVSSAKVELAGTDAALAAIAYFGGDFGPGNAADAMTDVVSA